MEFDCKVVPEAAERFYPALVRKYLQKDPVLQPFYNFFPDQAGYHQSIKEIRKRSYDRDVLVKALKRQHAGLSTPKKVSSYIESLQNGNVFTVCSGHQLQLMTGPLYFIYKIVTTVNLAATLSSMESDGSVVPVFWLAGEDHDITEISSVSTGSNRYTWKTEYQGPAGRMPGKGANEVIYEILQESKNLPFAGQLRELLEGVYSEDKNFNESTRELIYRIFGERSPLVIDPDDKELKKLLVPVMEAEFGDKPSFELVNHTTEKIRQSGLVSTSWAQLSARHSGYFYLPEKGGRIRIVPAGEGHWSAGDISWTTDQLLSEIRSDPSKFSPDAANRPVYQQTILPNLSYIGGPAEISYWLQLKELFDKHDCFFPVLHPRQSFLLLQESVYRKMEGLGLSLFQIFHKPEETLTALIRARDQGDLDFSEAADDLRAAIRKLEEAAARIDTTLTASVKGHEKKVTRSMERLERRFLAALKRQQKDLSKTLHEIGEVVYPNDTAQERLLNYCLFYAKWGDDLLEALFHCHKSFEHHPVVILEKSR